MTEDIKKEEQQENVNQPQEETRRCDICGQVLSRMWLDNTQQVDWLFKGEHAHLECYIDLHVNRSVKENLDKMCNDNDGRFVEAVEGLSEKIATQVYDEKKGFFSRLFYRNP